MNVTVAVAAPVAVAVPIIGANGVFTGVTELEAKEVPPEPLLSACTWNV